MNTSPPSDQELLLRFHEHRNEVAFTELYQRHAPLVFAVCRRVLRDLHLAEDAASATLLVLAKEAGPMSRDTRPLGPWLHRVATNIARDIWRRERRREVREQVAVAAATSQPDAAAAAELQARLHLEIERLPEKYRTAIVLHHLEGRSYDEAAAALGWNRNTFGIRLARAREKLRQRLVARGVTLGADGIGDVLEEGATSVALPAALVAATCQAASLLAAGKTLTGSGLVSAKVASLTKSALKTLFWAKVKTAAVAVVLGIGVVGSGVVAHRALAGHTAPPSSKPPTAVADAAGLTKLSADDAWLRELLVRAEAGPWDAVDFTRGSIFGDPGGWRLDLHGESAAWRIWQTDAQASSMVLFEAAKWKRGVVVGRVMMLPEGEFPAALVPPAEAAAPSWKQGGVMTKVDLPSGVYLALFPSWDAIWQTSILVLNENPRGVWHRFAVYFDTTAAPGKVALMRVWPADRVVPAAESWKWIQKEISSSISGLDAGVGLVARGVPVLWQSVKVVPLSADLPPPPGEGEK